MSDKLPGFTRFIAEASNNDVEDLLKRLREEGLPVTHSIFATIHHKSEERPDGFAPEDLDDIAENLQGQDRERWAAALEAHLAAKNSGA